MTAGDVDIEVGDVVGLLVIVPAELVVIGGADVEELLAAYQPLVSLIRHLIRYLQPQ